MLAVEVEVVLAVHRSADADLDEPLAVDEPFLDGAAERRAVKVLAAEVLVPGVDVRVELHQRERAVPLRQRAQDRQRDRVVAADHDRPRAGVGDRADPRLDRLVALLDADRRRVDVADVGDVQPIERRDLLEVAVRPDQRRLRADLARPEPRARPVRRAAVVRHADDRDVEAVRILDVRQPHERRRLREARRLKRRARLMRHERDCIVTVVKPAPRGLAPARRSSLAAARIAARAQEAIYVVRHAERADQSADSAALGRRASAAPTRLRDLLRDAGVTHIFTSELRRTIDDGGAAGRGDVT